ncbi:MAG: hypothetical protein ACRYG2_24840 [Janthinobacterium lividum]
MTEPSQGGADTGDRSRHHVAVGRALLPLWIAALSLAVIAAVMIISSVELIHAVRSTQASVMQLQQQVSQLKSGLGGLLGG